MEEEDFLWLGAKVPPVGKRPRCDGGDSRACNKRLHFDSDSST